MLHGVEGADIAVDVVFEAAGELGLVVGLERKHVEPAAAHGDGARILGADRQMPGDRALGDIDDGDAVARRKRHVGLAVAGEGDAHRLVEARGEALGMNVLHRSDDVMEERTVRVRIDHAHRVGHMVDHPDLATVRPHRNAHRIDAHRDPIDELPARGVDHVHRIARRVGDIDETASNGNGIEVGTGKGRMPNGTRLPTLVVRRGVAQTGRNRESNHGCRKYDIPASPPPGKGEGACSYERPGRPHACLQRLCVLFSALESSALAEQGQDRLDSRRGREPSVAPYFTSLRLGALGRGDGGGSVSASSGSKVMPIRDSLA